MANDQLPPLIGGILILIDLAIRITALIIVPRDRKPTAAMAWLLAIFLIPFIGIILFLVIGNSKLPKKRRDKQDELNRMIAERSSEVDLVGDRSAWPVWFSGLVRQNQGLGALPAVGGNSATLIGDYTTSIDAMAAEIDTATRFVQRRVLHRLVRRDHEGVLRRDGTRRAARRARASARRLRRLAARGQTATRRSPNSTASA